MAYEARLAVGAIEWLMEQKDLLTHRELCRTIDITPAQLSQIINGHRKLSASFILGVQKAYGIGPDHEIYIVKRKAEEDAAPRLVLRRENRQPVAR